MYLRFILPTSRDHFKNQIKTQNTRFTCKKSQVCACVSVCMCGWVCVCANQWLPTWLSQSKQWGQEPTVFKTCSKTSGIYQMTGFPNTREWVLQKFGRFAWWLSKILDTSSVFTSERCVLGFDFRLRTLTKRSFEKRFVQQWSSWHLMSSLVESS